MAYNKVIYCGRTLFDLTADTVAPGNILKGVTAHAADGSIITGTMEASVEAPDLDSPDDYILIIPAELITVPQLEESENLNGSNSSNESEETTEEEEYA